MRGKKLEKKFVGKEKNSFLEPDEGFDFVGGSGMIFGE